MSAFRIFEVVTQNFVAYDGDDLMHVGYEAAFQTSGGSADHVFFRQELNFCVRAEALGFDSVWLTEHHFSDYGLIPDPLQTLSWLAARTERVQLGTAVLVLPWHDPLRLAEQMLLADHLSGGRMVAGLGRGLSKYEFEGLRVPLEESRERFNEYARLLLDAWETGFAEGGGLTRQPRRELRPRPFKSFRGRVFSASVSPESAPLMARLGLGLMFIIVKPAELMAVDLRRYQAAWREAHGAGAAAEPPPQPLLSAVVVVDESADRAAELATKYNAVSRRIAVDHYRMAEPDFGTARGYEFYRQMQAAPIGAEAEDDKPPATVVYGTPQQVLEKFDKYREHLDMQGILAIFHGVPGEDGERNMRCFVKHCLPELKSWPARSTF